MSMLSRLLRRDDGDDDASIVIVPMHRKHIAEIMPIEDGSYPRPWTSGVFTSELEMARRGERTYLVAKRGGRLVGYAGTMYVVGDAHVTNIVVKPSEQRRGIATRLLAELAWAARDRGCVAMTLEVRVSNTGAQGLYRTFGFVPAGVRQRYYENTEDAIVMWCHDIDGTEYKARLRQLCPEAAR
ncbi:MAG: rimI [Ilumatobacteraceae bacterium]|jgi:ribosomal-protein-alanine N-acetyltransferase|nr:rimI [Ilumatobacteraceae bacterium]